MNQGQTSDSPLATIMRLFDHHSEIILTIALMIVVLGVASLSWFQQPHSASITNFSQCAAAQGSRILESYPEQCITADGKSFTNIIIPTPTTPNASSSATPTQPSP